MRRIPRNFRFRIEEEIEKDWNAETERGRKMLLEDVTGLKLRLSNKVVQRYVYKNYNQLPKHIKKALFRLSFTQGDY